MEKKSINWRQPCLFQEECVVVVVVLLLLLMTSTNNQAGGVNIFLAPSWASLAVTSA
jgi:hypothetical protein